MLFKTLLLSFAFACSSFGSYSQRGFEYDAGYGMYSLETMLYEPHKHANYAFADLTYLGSLFVTCRYRAAERFAGGLTANYFKSTRDGLGEQIQTIGIAPDLAFAYNTSGFVRAYMSAAGGLTYVIPKGSNYWEPIFHFSPVGISFGRKIAGFVELGIGSKGLLNAGISYFPAHKKPGKWY